MNPLRRFGKWLRTSARAATRKVRGSYDAAQTSPENEDYWAWSDALNANAANSVEVRKTLRERARYQRDNDGHMGGLVERISRDLVGTGPRIQLALPATWIDPDFGTEMTTPPDAAHRVERLFGQHCRTVGLSRKLRVLHEARLVDGEGFAVMVTNPQLPSVGPQIDLRLYECDQVDTPFFSPYDPLAFPGGTLDEAGNVVEWHLLRSHPGSPTWSTNYSDFDRVPSHRVIHWYKARRPGQLRGITEAAPGLPLYAYLRRYTLAVLGSAETAAKIAAMIKVDAPPPADDGTPAKGVADMDQVPIPRNALLTTYGDVTQLKAEQPTTQYPAFKGEILTEAGAPFGAPRNVSTNSSAEYNYSSGRLDHLPYERMIAVIRGDLREVAIDPFFRAWHAEARLIPGYLPEGLPPVELWSWEWHFDGFDSIDPLKDAKTDQVNLAIGATNLAQIHGRRGGDWEEAMKQRGRELQLAKRLEIELGIAAGSLSGTGPAPDPNAPLDPEAVPNGAEQTSAA